MSYCYFIIGSFSYKVSSSKKKKKEYFTRSLGLLVKVTNVRISLTYYILDLFFLWPCTAIKVPGTSKIKTNTKQAHVHKLASTQQPHL